MLSFNSREYSEIPLLRPSKIKASYLLKILFAKFKLFFSSFSTPSVPLIRDHFWDCPKVVLKTTFGQSQWWSLIRGRLGVENEEKNNLNLANKVFNG